MRMGIMRMQMLKWSVLVALTLVLLVAQPCRSQDGNQPRRSDPAVVNVSDFTSLQAAFDSLPEAGGIVQLPAARIEIHEPVLVSSGNLLIRGAGAVSHIHNANTAGKSAFIVTSGRPASRQRGNIEPLWRVQMSDFRLTGNDNSGHGIEACYVNEIYLDGVTVSDHGGDGVHLHFCYEDPRVNNALLTYNKGVGVYAIGCHDTVVAACQFEENKDAIRFIDGFNLTANGNNIDDHLQHGIVVANSMGNTIAGNMIEQCGGIGVVLERDTYGTTVSSNVFTNDREGGVALRDAHGCTVTGNTFSRVPKRAVAIDAESHATTINGNTFAESSVGDGKYKGNWDVNVASGIVLEGASFVNITGNTFSNLQTKAIALNDVPSSSVIFSSNLLLNTPSDHARLIDSVIQGNLQRTDATRKATALAIARTASFRGLQEINPPAAPTDDSGIAIVGATLIDGRGGPPVSDSVVLVHGKRITKHGNERLTEDPGRHGSC